MSITVNGRQYAAWEDVPAYLRELLRLQFPDHDGNGVPDIFEGHVGPESRSLADPPS